MRSKARCSRLSNRVSCSELAVGVSAGRIVMVGRAVRSYYQGANLWAASFGELLAGRAVTDRAKLEPTLEPHQLLRHVARVRTAGPRSCSC